MSKEQSSQFCARCDRATLAQREGVGVVEVIVHVVLMLVTGLLWAPIAILHILVTANAPFRCQTCGTPIGALVGPVK